MSDLARTDGGIVEAFLTGRTPTTLLAYRRDLDDFAAWLGVADAESAARRLLSADAGEAHRLALAYRSSLRERSLSASTVNRRLAALRSLVRLGRMVGAVVWELEVPGLRSEGYRDTRGPGIDAVRRILRRAAADRTPVGRRDYVVLRLLFDLGLRRSETASLDFVDVDLERGSIAVRGKGRHEKSLLSLPEPTAEALAAWLLVRGATDGPLLTSFDPTGKGDGRIDGATVWRIVRRRSAAVGVTAAPHGLRHTAITEACKAASTAGIGLEEVLDFSRHANVATLMVYRDRERNVQGALASLVAQAGGEV